MNGSEEAQTTGSVESLDEEKKFIHEKMKVLYWGCRFHVPESVLRVADEYNARLLEIDQELQDMRRQNI